MATEEVPSTSPQPSLSGTYDERLHLVHEGTDVPIAHQPYRVTAANGNVFEGVTDQHGYAKRIYLSSPQALSIEVLESNSSKIILISPQVQ